MNIITYTELQHFLARSLQAVFAIQLCFGLAAQSNAAAARAGAVLDTGPVHTNEPVVCLGSTQFDRPDLGCILRLKEADRPALLRAWRQGTGLKSRIQLAYGLAWLGNDEIAKEFATAFCTIGGRKKLRFSQADDETQAHTMLIVAMGVCAQRSDFMLQFLDEHTDWRIVRRDMMWHESNGKGGDDGVAMVLAGEITASLGESGREEAMQKLRSIRESKAYLGRSTEFPDVVNNSQNRVMKGAFRWYAVRRFGRQAALEMWVSRTRSREMKVAWLATPEGKEWSAWAPHPSSLNPELAKLLEDAFLEHP